MIAPQPASWIKEMGAHRKTWHAAHDLKTVEALVAKHGTQAKLARACGLSESTVSGRLAKMRLLKNGPSS